MREKRPAARHLVFQRRTQLFCLNSDQKQIVLPGKMLVSGFPRLLRR